MLIPIRFYDWDTDFRFRPELRDGLVNTDHIVSALPHDCARCGAVVKVSLAGGGHVLVEGTIEQFQPAAPADIKGGGD